MRTWFINIKDYYIFCNILNKLDYCIILDDMFYIYEKCCIYDDNLKYAFDASNFVIKDMVNPMFIIYTVAIWQWIFCNILVIHRTYIEFTLLYWNTMYYLVNTIHICMSILFV